MQRHPIAILGASGYTGVELTRLVAAHPGVELVVAGSDRWAGDSVERWTGAGVNLRYLAPDRALAEAAGCAAVLLATPAEVSQAIVPKLVTRVPEMERGTDSLRPRVPEMERGTDSLRPRVPEMERGTDSLRPRVIDLSGAFRLREAASYPAHYGFEHAHAALLREAVYGLPELGRARLAGARLVANPGCYATAIQLALAPITTLVTGRLIVDAVSGVTGAGRKATEDMSFAEVAGDVRAYRVLRHQHTPEIEQQLEMPVTFVAHLVPIARGILATCHAQLAPGVDASAIAAAFDRAYAHEPFISLAPDADAVAIHDVVGTNRCRIGHAVGQRGELVITAAIDNLVKGAAGQAVQNLNLVLGLPETTGLTSLRSFHP